MGDPMQKTEEGKSQDGSSIPGLERISPNLRGKELYKGKGFPENKWT